MAPLCTTATRPQSVPSPLNLFYLYLISVEVWNNLVFLSLYISQETLYYWNQNISSYRNISLTSPSAWLPVLALPKMGNSQVPFELPPACVGSDTSHVKYTQKALYSTLSPSGWKLSMPRIGPTLEPKYSVWTLWTCHAWTTPFGSGIVCSPTWCYPSLSMFPNLVLSLPQSEVVVGSGLNMNRGDA